jgi:hypothetical protein
MILTEKQVDYIFETSADQSEATIALYKIAFPEFDRIKQVDGFPAIGKELSLHIWNKFFEFDRLHHPGVMPGGRWMNNGFSTDETLKPWELSISSVNVIMED